MRGCQESKPRKPRKQDSDIVTWDKTKCPRKRAHLPLHPHLRDAVLEHGLTVVRAGFLLAPAAVVLGPLHAFDLRPDALPTSHQVRHFVVRRPSCHSPVRVQPRLAPPRNDVPGLAALHAVVRVGVVPVQVHKSV